MAFGISSIDQLTPKLVTSSTKTCEQSPCPTFVGDSFFQLNQPFLSCKHAYLDKLMKGSPYFGIECAFNTTCKHSAEWVSCEADNYHRPGCHDPRAQNGLQLL
eukprot:3078016-Amphidinium_carterae.2